MEKIPTVRMARDGYLLISILFYITGISYVAIGQISPGKLCIYGGILLIAYGIVKMIGYFSNDLYNLAFQYDLACGLLLMVVGVIVLACNLRIRAYLAPGLGLLILLDAVLKCQMSEEAKRFGLETWKRILGCSVLAAVFGIWIIVQSFSAAGNARLLIGCGLVAEGLMNHLTVLETVKIARTDRLKKKEMEYHGRNDND